MIKLIGKDKETGAMVIENNADFNRIGLANFIAKLDRHFHFRIFTRNGCVGFAEISFWIETDKVNER